MDCPVCGSNEWDIHDVAALPHMHTGPGKPGMDIGRLIPVVPMMCSNCGFYYLFSALKIGLRLGQ